MSNTHRIAWIDGQIRAARYPNASAVAERFEISRRQAARDLEYLRYSLGAPLAFSREHNGYAYTDDAFALPSVVLTETERAALTYLAHQYRAMPGDAAAEVAAALERLCGQVVTESSRPPPLASLDGRELRAIETLNWAIEHRRKVAIRYRGADGVIVPRTASPFGVVRRRGLLCCTGYYDEIGHVVWLPIGRFESIDLLDETFEVPAHVKPHDDVATMYPEPFVAVVRLVDARNIERLDGAVLGEDGCVRLEFYDSSSVMSMLLACPSPFEIVSPSWLRERLLRRLTHLAEVHEP